MMNEPRTKKQRCLNTNSFFSHSFEPLFLDFLQQCNKKICTDNNDINNNNNDNNNMLIYKEFSRLDYALDYVISYNQKRDANKDNYVDINDQMNSNDECYSVDNNNNEDSTNKYSIMENTTNDYIDNIDKDNDKDNENTNNKDTYNNNDTTTNNNNIDNNNDIDTNHMNTNKDECNSMDDNNNKDIEKDHMNNYNTNECNSTDNNNDGNDSNILNNNNSRYLNMNDYNDILRIFQYEDYENGKRRFIATTYNVFFHKYIRLPKSRRHYYELIQESMPCRLYFDIEFLWEYNPHINKSLSDEIMIILKNEIYLMMNKLLKKNLSKKCILDLESTTDKKFSRHLLCYFINEEHTKEVAVFANNMQAGYFVEYLCRHIISKINHSRLNNEVNKLEKLLINMNEKGTKSLLIDTGVYSRNRFFRMFLSTKYGKHSYLKVSSASTFESLRIHNESLLKRIFFDSLIMNTPVYAKLLEMKDYKVAHMPHLIPINSDDQQYLENINIQSVSKRRTDIKLEHLKGLQNFINSIVSGEIKCIGHAWQHLPWCNGYISSYNKLSDSIICFQIGGTRYCCNIGRQHKSNNIYMVCNLEQRIIYQKCFDPDCKHFTSIPIPIPPTVLESNEAQTKFEDELLSIKINMKSEKTRKLESELENIDTNWCEDMLI